MTVGNARVITISTMNTPVRSKRKSSSTYSASNSKKRGIARLRVKDVAPGETLSVYGRKTRPPANIEASLVRGLLKQLCPTMTFSKDYFGGAYVNSTSDNIYKGGWYEAGKQTVQFMHGCVYPDSGATRVSANSADFSTYGNCTHSGITFDEMTTKLMNDANLYHNTVATGTDQDRNPLSRPLYYMGGSYTHSFNNRTPKPLKVVFYEYTPKRHMCVFDGGNSPDACRRSDFVSATAGNLDSGSGSGYNNTWNPVQTQLTTTDFKFNYDYNGNYIKSNYTLLTKREVEISPGATAEFTVNIPPFTFSDDIWKNQLNIGRAGNVGNATFKPNALKGVTKFACFTFESVVGTNNLTKVGFLFGAGNPDNDVEFSTVGRGGLGFSHVCKEKFKCRAMGPPAKNINYNGYLLDQSTVDFIISETDTNMAVDAVAGQGLQEEADPEQGVYPR